jgi:hypothetical protein
MLEEFQTVKVATPLFTMLPVNLFYREITLYRFVGHSEYHWSKTISEGKTRP